MEIRDDGYYILTEEEKERLREKCRGKSLADLRPDLASQWHYEKNGDLGPDMVTAKSNKKYWWKYLHWAEYLKALFVFEWQASPNNRCKSPGIPFLAPNPKVWTGFNDLQTLYPEIADQWHTTKNGNMTPQMVTPYSNKKVWWTVSLTLEDGSIILVDKYESVADKVKRVNPTQISTKYTVIKGVNDLATFYPEIAKELHPTKNGNVTAEMIHRESEKKFWWLLPYDDPITGKHFNFEWFASVYGRTVSKLGCPYLSGKAVWPGFNDFATLCPHLLSDWDFDKNINVDPTRVTKHSHVVVWWKCYHFNPKTQLWEKHFWQDSIHNRSSGVGCPALSGSRLEQLLFDIFKSHNISFKKECKFSNCKYKGDLRFDLYIEDQNILIEADGKQHFESVLYFGGDSGWKERIEKDNIKTNYCLQNNISLLRIPYIYNPISHKAKIEQIVLDFIQTKQVPQEIIDFYSQFPFSNYGKILQKQNS